MTQPFDIESYVQGYRFSDDPMYYDSSTQTFKDLAGYGESAGLKIPVGTPTFDTVDGFRVVNFDNTFYGNFEVPNSWHGSMVLVMRPEFSSSGTQTLYPILFGDNVSTPTQNGSIRFVHFSGNITARYAGPSGTIQGSEAVAAGSAYVFGGAHDQQTRKAYSTLDGITINESSAVSGTTHGNSCYMPTGESGARIGDLNGDPSDQTDNTSVFYMRAFEMHLFQGNIWTEYPTKALALVNTLKDKYDIT